jgi:phage gp16-like protein
MAANHVAAIHVLKARLGLDEDYYRALLIDWVGKRSCSGMTVEELLTVRGHLENLVRKHGLAVDAGAPTRRRRLSREQFEKAKKEASPRERKVWALWHSLGRAGLVNDTGARALDHYVERQVHVSALRFCTAAQLDTLIESLKGWARRDAGAPQRENRP